MRSKLFSYILTINRNRVFGKITFHFLYIIVKLTGKRVIYNYAGQNITIPVNHSLPQNMAVFPNYSINLRKVIESLNLIEQDIIVDIGANIGDTVALLRPVTKAAIICIEGDEQYLELLKINTQSDSNVRIIKSFLGERDEVLNTKQVHEKGTGRLIDDSKTSMEIKSLDTLLFNEVKGAVKVLKIDTDGYDNKIIRGSKKIIEKFKPVIFFEYDPWFLERAGENGLDIFDFLIELGYSEFEMYDNWGDLICICHKNNKDIIRGLHQYYCNRKGERYMDIAAYI